MNRFETRILDTLRRRGDGVRHARVLVACSGGGDSTALLALLWALRKSLDLELVVAHADHALRAESEEDAQFVREICRHLDVDLAEARLEVRRHAEAEHLGLEMAARELRWEWLKAEAASVGADCVATGHTLDDHTETVLMRLARGGGLGSLTPLPPRQELRWSPLIEARREELRDYLRQKRLPWREDASNLEDFTARNRWRALLEQIRQEAPALDAHLWETHAQAAELLEWREAQIQRLADHWRLDEGALWIKGPLGEVELRACLEAGFRRTGWPREAVSLRDLCHWLMPLLSRRTRKPKAFGHWALEPGHKGGWILKQASARMEESPPKHDIPRA